MKLFISYAHVDKFHVKLLVDILRSAGLDPWFDHRLTVGRDWKEQLRESIVACDYFLYALSPESVASEWCQWEFAEAVKLGKPIIPVLLQAKTSIPDALSRYQYADFTDGPTPEGVAHLLGGLLHVRVTIPLSEAPNAPSTPRGVPTSAPLNMITSPFTTKSRVEDLLPSPFVWCPVTAGKVTIENKIFDVPAFSIAKYPVTNAQFAKFIEAKGYDSRVWWTDQGWMIREQQKWVEPHYWMDSQWNSEDQPVVGVSWFEAVAFCSWLSNTVGEEITLPTEQQWQRAAQGGDERVYPWGKEWDSRRCNNSANTSQSTQTSSVTKYEGKGDSPFKVVDMAGNVGEWCSTNYLNGEQATDKPAAYRVLRGGSWRTKYANLFRVDYRGRVDPSLRECDWGFRVSSILVRL